MPPCYSRLAVIAEASVCACAGRAYILSCNAYLQGIHVVPCMPACDSTTYAVHACAQVSLQLTPEQKERLLAARTYLLAQMMEIIQERTLIISMLQVNPPPIPFLCSNPLAMACLCCWPSRVIRY